MEEASSFTHAKGMVDITHKTVTHRTARASACIRFQRKAFEVLMKEGSPKGNVLETARIAGMMAAKATSQIIPHCHPLMLTKVQFDFRPLKTKNAILIFAEVSCQGQTGVEMEALQAVTTAALTIYDMMKWSGQDMIITDVMLLEKHGGKSGDFSRTDQ
jgi:cyclic pyranopterin phosphate synthase